MLHAELGRFPLEINIKVRMINFWLSIVTGKPSKFSYILYKCLLNDTDDGIYEHKWIKKVQVGKDQEKAQSEKDSHSKNRGGKKPN